MAQVTYSTPKPLRHILGDLAVKFFVVSGASGSTLPTGLQQILFATQQAFTQAGTASLLTGLSISGSTITLTSSGPMVREVIMVIGREG